MLKQGRGCGRGCKHLLGKERGSRPECCCPLQHGKPALFFAAMNGRAAVVKQLLAAEAEATFVGKVRVSGDDAFG